METKIIFSYPDNYVIINNKLHKYQLYSGRIWDYFNIKKLMLDDMYFDQTREAGYTLYQKAFWNKENRNTFYIPLSRNFLEFYQLYWSNESYKEEYIALSKTDLNHTVDFFYEFSLEIEINGLRTKFIQSLDDKDLLYIDKQDNNKKLEIALTPICGEAQIPSDVGYDKGGPYYYYIIPINKIDKIIGIKHFRDTSSFGSYDGEEFTGEKEEIILDIHNFDEKIYKIFKEHGILEIKE